MKYRLRQCRQTVISFTVLIKKKKGFKKIAVISKAGTKKYLDKKAKRGKTAYYKIKSFKNINGGKVLSGKYSKVVKKKR